MKIEQHPLFSNQTHQANRDFLYHAVDVYYQMTSYLVVFKCTKELSSWRLQQENLPKQIGREMKNIRLKLLLNSAVSVFIN